MPIRHSDLTPAKINKLRSIYKVFFDKVFKAAETRARKDKPKWRPWLKEDDDETLLNCRRELAKYVKKGMLERQDMETEIAMLAGVIWYLRQSHEERMRLETSW
jgi:hypothetical protein